MRDLNTRWLLLMLASSWSISAIAQFHDGYSQQALFIRDIDAPSPYSEHTRHNLFDQTSDRIPRQSSDSTPTKSTNSAAMDQTVQGILEWLQGKYSSARKARQETPVRQYLPSRVAPTTTQKPRPFQTSNNDYSSFLGNNEGSNPSGYPYAQPPNPSFNIPETPSPYTPTGTTTAPYNPSSTGGTISPYGGSSGSAAPYSPSSLSLSQGSSQQPYSPSSTPQSPYNLPSSPQPPYNPSSPSQPPYNPSTSPESPYNPPSSPQSPYNPSSSQQSPYNPSSLPQPSYNPSSSPQSPYNPPSSPQSSYDPPSSPQSPYNPSSTPQSPNNPPSSPQSPYNPPSSPQSPFPSGEPGPSQIPFVPSTDTGFSTTGVGFPSPPETPTGPATGFFPVDNNIDSDEAHPPHIHQINVQCAKDMMTIDIEFNRPFNGIIYSKGYYNSPECRYVNPNSDQIRYTFTVQLNSCGTQFVDQFSEGKQAYLENVLVLQNEPGIQEVGVASPALRPVWDVIRSVRCLWEGSLNKALSVALSVGMLSQEIVTFSGDTATAKLDIQMGRGPYAAAANGLVKIGETMTLVVTVEGDPGFNILVRQCVARDSDPTSGNVVRLTDDRGCVVKPKLMGAFQTTRNPDTNAVIAYAFFQAFKFPDVMDLTIECNVELCKTECAPCSDANQKLEPGRRRRSVDNATVELTDPVTVGRRLRVFLPEDLEQTGQGPAMVINVGSTASSQDSVCLSSSVFLTSSAVLLTLLGVSSVFSAALWLKMQHQTLRK